MPIRQNWPISQSLNLSHARARERVAFGRGEKSTRRKSRDWGGTDVQGAGDSFAATGRLDCWTLTVEPAARSVIRKLMSEWVMNSVNLTPAPMLARLKISPFGDDVLKESWIQKGGEGRASAMKHYGYELLCEVASPQVSRPPLPSSPPLRVGALFSKNRIQCVTLRWMDHRKCIL